MNTTHIFLCAFDTLPSDRWREAFPSGQVLEADALLAQLRGQPSTPCVVWLSSAQPQWSEQLHQVLEVQSATKVILLSNAPEPQEGLLAIDQGVRGYTHAYAVPGLLQEVALVVAHGGLWVGPELLQRLLRSTSAALAKLPTPASRPAASGWAKLSAREAQVAHAVSEGRSNKEIASQMFISERTVKAHLGAMFEKLGVRDRLQLVLQLAASGDAPPPSTMELRS